MDALDEQLVSREDKLIKLLTPPIDRSDPSPGYIQGYVQGVRENGGQYTHAAVWAAMAFAELGDTPRAWDLFDILNPIRHAQTGEEVATYKTEPYVVASDVYSTTGHVGRGGWTWYTGAAGWLYRCITESLLGLVIEGDMLILRPRIPADWTTFGASYSTATRAMRSRSCARLAMKRQRGRRRVDRGCRRGRPYVGRRLHPDWAGLIPCHEPLAEQSRPQFTRRSLPHRASPPLGVASAS